MLFYIGEYKVQSKVLFLFYGINHVSKEVLVQKKILKD